MSTDKPSHEEVVESTAATAETMRPQQVPVNMYETSAALVIVAPLPAVKPSDVTIEVRPGHVRFWATLRSEGPREHLLREWSYGGYERELEIPDGFGSSVESTLTNGQLVIRVLRGEATEPLTVSPGDG